MSDNLKRCINAHKAAWEDPSRIGEPVTWVETVGDDGGYMAAVRWSCGKWWHYTITDQGDVVWW